MDYVTHKSHQKAKIITKDKIRGIIMYKKKEYKHWTSWNGMTKCESPNSSPIKQSAHK